MAQDGCGCETTTILVFPCAGGSNVGQLSNAAAVELARQGKARLYCLAGMGAHVSGMVDSAAGADVRISLDGCPTACARKTLEQAGLVVDKGIVVTSLGIEKNHELAWTEAELAIVMEATAEGIEAMQAGHGCDCTGE